MSEKTELQKHIEVLKKQIKLKELVDVAGKTGTAKKKCKEIWV